MATRKKKTVRSAGKRVKPAVKRTVKKVAKRRPVRRAARRPTTMRGADRLHARTGLTELSESQPRDEVWEIFRRYDVNGSGFIDRSELAHLCEALGMALGEDELLVAFDVVDANHSGKISWEEFSAWWRNQ